MHRAGAAKRHAAAELRAGHAQHIAQHPEKRRVAVDIDYVCRSVDFDGEGHGVFSFLPVAAEGDQPAATSTTASAKACGASCGSSLISSNVPVSSMVVLPGR